MFLDERITERILYGSGAAGEYQSRKHVVRGGADYRWLVSPYELFDGRMLTLDMDDVLQRDIVKFHQRALGGFKSFRVKRPYDYSTNDQVGVPTHNDGKCEVGSAGWHITAWYDLDSIDTAPRRRVLKPNVGTVVAGIRDDLGNPHQLGAGLWSVDNTTGIITFPANTQKVITGITQASSAVIALGASHGHVADDSLHLSAVVGMTEINGLRCTVLSATPTTVTVDIDSTLFTAYTSGGATNTAPQTNETVTAGCYFDIPCVFEDPRLEIDFTNYKILSASVGVIETYNP